MHYPTISQYVEHFSQSELSFRTLRGMEPARTLRGEPWFGVGNFAVIFKVYIAGRAYALKCYTRDPGVYIQRYTDFDAQELSEVCGDSAVGSFTQLSEYVVPFRYLPREIYIYDEHDRGDYFPLLLSPWVEGESLGRYVGRLSQGRDQAGLRSLALRFDRLARWLLEQPFAHGDLKHDNILVSGAGELRLIDWDGAYVPNCSAQRSPQLGSPAYQHPLRDEHLFNRQVDDYSIGVIALSLHALALDTTLYDRFNDRDRLIFNAAELADGKSALAEELEGICLERGESALLALLRRLIGGGVQIEQLDSLLERLLDEPTQGVALHEREVLERLGCEGIDLSDRQWALVRKQGLYGYADLERVAYRIDPLFSSAEPFSEGLALVETPQRRGFVNRAGEWVIDLSDYDRVNSFREGLSRVHRHSGYGFIDRQGVEVIEAKHEFVGSFHEALAAAKRSERWGYINPAGEWVIEPQYEWAKPFRLGRAEVGVADRVLHIDATGRPISE